LYAYEPNLVLAPTSTVTTSTAVQEFVQNRDRHLEALKHHLTAAQNRMKLQADKKRTDRQFQVGDQVLLKLQPYVQTSVANRPYPKISFKYFGPYTVLARIGPVAYKLQLSEGAQIHPMFHISQLKPFTPNYTPVFEQLPQVTDLTVVDTSPEVILDRRLVKKGNVTVPQVKVKWTNLPEAAATWEDMYVLRQRFSGALAWGQANSLAGGGVTPTAI
jgi:hypothetical protein